MKMTVNNKHKARVKTRAAVRVEGIVKKERKLQKGMFQVSCEIEMVIVENTKVEFWNDWHSSFGKLFRKTGRVIE
jgi:hypothetical protein